LVLASTSSARRGLLSALGLTFEAVAPDFEEHLDPAVPPGRLVEALSLGKAQSVAKRHPDAIVIGSDQICTFGGEIWGKPKDRADAAAKLAQLAGRTHTIVTGLAVLAPGFEHVEHELSHLTVFPLSDAEQQAYLDTDEWVGCAGGYRIESRGLALFSDIQGDLHTIRGLPVTRLLRVLRALKQPLF
jgi:septum formation protein